MNADAKAVETEANAAVIGYPACRELEQDVQNVVMRSSAGVFRELPGVASHQVRLCLLVTPRASRSGGTPHRAVRTQYQMTRARPVEGH